MKVLIACEFSGTVRDAFARLGHDVMSCDLLPSDTIGKHYQGDVMDIINDGWDLMIAHPPCTYLSNTSAQWLHKQEGRWEKMREAALFFKQIMNAPIKKIAIENPIPHRYGLEIIGQKYSQIIHPWQFGDRASKSTCLWLKNLPLLTHTNVVDIEYVYSKKTGRRFEKFFWDNSILKGEERRKARSKTFQGIADAMAAQWSVEQAEPAKQLYLFAS
jgi:hypothetical protein